jgi:hypothetical protein
MPKKGMALSLCLWIDPNPLEEGCQRIFWPFGGPSPRDSARPPLSSITAQVGQNHGPAPGPASRARNKRTHDGKNGVTAKMARTGGFVWEFARRHWLRRSGHNRAGVTTFWPSPGERGRNPAFRGHGPNRPFLKRPKSRFPSEKREASGQDGPAISRGLAMAFNDIVLGRPLDNRISRLPFQVSTSLGTFS